jgi:hypothetical protein
LEEVASGKQDNSENDISLDKIKSNLNYFNSNSISSIELTSNGEISLNYDKGE